MSGTLYLVATPIGNLSDMSPRAVETLKKCSRIFCEDTRRTSKLTQHFNIKVPRESLHGFSEKKKVSKVISLLEDNLEIALVSDAGTPVISDPGKILVRTLLDKKFTVTAVPGPSAAATAFSSAGAESSSFVFAGFLPSKGKVRRDTLDKFLDFGLPVVFYESPGRVENLIEHLHNKKARIVICREMTKHHEEIFVHEKGRPVTCKGEFTVVAEPYSSSDSEKNRRIDSKLISKLEKYEMSSKDKLYILNHIYPEKRKSELKKVVFP
ncbi:MAG: 16S rRNA (cytidine(1402)-2'-O)-methyltransferase [bacterium]